MKTIRSDNYFCSTVSFAPAFTVLNLIFSGLSNTSIRWRVEVFATYTGFIGFAHRFLVCTCLGYVLSMMLVCLPLIPFSFSTGSLMVFISISLFLYFLGHSLLPTHSLHNNFPRNIRHTFYHLARYKCWNHGALYYRPSQRAHVIFVFRHGKHLMY